MEKENNQVHETKEFDIIKLLKKMKEADKPRLKKIEKMTEKQKYINSHLIKRGVLKE